MFFFCVIFSFFGFCMFSVHLFKIQENDRVKSRQLLFCRLSLLPSLLIADSMDSSGFITL